METLRVYQCDKQKPDGSLSGSAHTASIGDELFQMGCAINRANAQTAIQQEDKYALFRSILPELRRCILQCQVRACTGAGNSEGYYDELLEKLNRCV